MLGNHLFIDGKFIGELSSLQVAGYRSVEAFLRCGPAAVVQSDRSRVRVVLHGGQELELTARIVTRGDVVQLSEIQMSSRKIGDVLLPIPRGVAKIFLTVPGPTS